MTTRFKPLLKVELRRELQNSGIGRAGYVAKSRGGYRVAGVEKIGMVKHIKELGS